jgi:hypothetical protein
LGIDKFIKIEAATNGAAQLSAEVSATLELRCPAILGRRVFEGVLHTPSGSGFFPDGLISATGRPGETNEELVNKFREARQRTQLLSEPERERFALAVRWFAKGRDTTNPIDRFLALYICLEIFPAMGSTDVVRLVRDFVRARAAPELDKDEVTNRIGIGRICGKRAEIVHDGLVAVDLVRDQEFRVLLKQLEASVCFCLRTLGGLPPGDELEAYVHPKTSAPGAP